MTNQPATYEALEAEFDKDWTATKTITFNGIEITRKEAGGYWVAGEFADNLDEVAEILNR